jgi:hypothetical protein
MADENSIRWTRNRPFLRVNFCFGMVKLRLMCQCSVISLMDRLALSCSVLTQTHD